MVGGVLLAGGDRLSHDVSRVRVCPLGAVLVACRDEHEDRVSDIGIDQVVHLAGTEGLLLAVVPFAFAVRR